MLRITTMRSNGRIVLKLEGRFAGPWVQELDACWRAASETSGQSAVWVDLSGVTWVDGAGEEQLGRMRRAGVRLRAQGCAMRALVQALARRRSRTEGRRRW